MHVASCASLADCWISGFHWEILLSTSWTRLGCLQPLYKCQLVKSVKRSFLQRVNRQLKGCVGIWWNMSHRSTCIKHCFIITCTLDTHTKKKTSQNIPVIHPWRFSRTPSLATASTVAQSKPQTLRSTRPTTLDPILQGPRPRPAVSTSCTLLWQIWQTCDRNQASHPAVVSFAQGSLQSQAWPPGWKTMLSDAQKAEPLGISYLGYTGYTSTSPKLMCSFLFLPSLTAGYLKMQPLYGIALEPQFVEAPGRTDTRTADSKLMLTQCADLVTHNYPWVNELNKNLSHRCFLSFWHRNLCLALPCKKSEFWKQISLQHASKQFQTPSRSLPKQDFRWNSMEVFNGFQHARFTGRRWSLLGHTFWPRHWDMLMPWSRLFGLHQFDNHRWFSIVFPLKI